VGATSAFLWNRSLILAAAGVSGRPLTGNGQSVLVESVLYDGSALNDADEAVRLLNAGATPVDLTDWELSDGTTDATLPDNLVIAAGEAIWLTGNALAFRAQFGHDPDVVLAQWPGFANSGDEVRLLDAAGALVDAVVYENGDPNQAGWTGPTIHPYQVSGLFAEEGQVLFRQRDQSTGDVLADNNTAADWAQSTTDVINGRKVRFAGWNSDNFFFPPLITATATLTVAVAPDNAFETVERAITNAEISVQVGSLTLENIRLGQALADAANRGVAVNILLEGGPPGGIPDQERFVCGLIEEAGGACWFMISNPDEHIEDRYRFMHAKYMIIDNRVTVISSENFSDDSLPHDDKSDGTWGRRGVIMLTDSPEVAQSVQSVFLDDLDLAHGDLFRWNQNDPVYGAPPSGFIPDLQSGGITYTVRLPYPAIFFGTHGFEVLSSPDNALRTEGGLLGLIGEAGEGDQLLVQQLDERPYWGESTSNPAADPNPRLEFMIDAARRGVDVRILLDSYFDDPDSPVGNAATCAYVNEIARLEVLTLRCALANPTGLGLHNKMVLARIGGRGYVHVGSINGTELSNKGNREMALQVQSDPAYAFLAGLFIGDTPTNIHMPLAAANYRGSVNRLLISEVVYDPPGDDQAEFVELVNPTPSDVELSGYALGDAVFQTDFEDTRLFPPGIIIPAYGTVVVTLNAVAFREEYGVEPQVEIVDSDPAVPNMIDDPAWGDPAALFQLGNTGDEVLLWHGGLIDVVTYGDGFHSEVSGCPLLTLPNRTLERSPYWDDTNNCSVDFRLWPFPSPNQLP
jgi:phosphatidylserine/phosphatidylglycerophosphate/cardiolipin synthase-like enzyme